LQIFFHFSPKKLQNEENSKPKKTFWFGMGEGLIQLLNDKISPNYVAFTKEMKVKYILTSLK
jgi:hypothetical protein